MASHTILQKLEIRFKNAPRFAPAGQSTQMKKRLEELA